MCVYYDWSQMTKKWISCCFRTLITRITFSHSFVQYACDSHEYILASIYLNLFDFIENSHSTKQLRMKRPHKWGTAVWETSSGWFFFTLSVWKKTNLLLYTWKSLVIHGAQQHWVISVCSENKTTHMRTSTFRYLRESTHFCWPIECWLQ